MEQYFWKLIFSTAAKVLTKLVKEKGQMNNIRDLSKDGRIQEVGEDNREEYDKLKKKINPIRLTM